MSKSTTMVTESKYELSQTAYIKLVLHSLKHRSTAVNGVLIGSSSDSNAVTIADAVPLSHSLIGLLPSLELALNLVEEHFGGSGLSVVGYYHANERADDLALGNAAKKIGDHIARYFSQAVVLLVDTEKMESMLKQKGRDPVVQLYSKDSSKNWHQSGDQLTLKEPSANAVLLDYIVSEKWQEVVDFDDHLDDISKDWLNPALFK